MANTDEDESAANKTVKVKAMTTFNATLSKKKSLMVSKVDGKFVVTGDYTNLVFAVPISFEDFDFSIFKNAGTMNSHLHRERILEITKDVKEEVFALMLAITSVCPKKSRVLTFFQSATKAKSIKLKEEVIKDLKNFTVEYPRQEKEDKFSLQTLASAFASHMLMFSVLIHRSDKIEDYYNFDYLAQMAITDDIGKEVKEALFKKWSAYGPSKNSARNKDIAIGFIEQFFNTRYTDAYVFLLPDGTVFTDQMITKDLFKTYVAKVLSFSKSSGTMVNASVVPVTKSTKTLMLEAKLMKAKTAEKVPTGFQSLLTKFSSAVSSSAKPVDALAQELAASVEADKVLAETRLAAEVAAVEQAAKKGVPLQTMIATGSIPLVTSSIIETVTSAADTVAKATEVPGWIKEMEVATSKADQAKIDELIRIPTEELTIMSSFKGKFMIAAPVADRYFCHILSTVDELDKVQVLYENLIAENTSIYKSEVVMPVMEKLYEKYNQLDFEDVEKYVEFEELKKASFASLASIYENKSEMFAV